jgi:hypothetical protein
LQMGAPSISAICKAPSKCSKPRHDAPRRGPCRRACGVQKEVAAAAFLFSLQLQGRGNMPAWQRSGI